MAVSSHFYKHLVWMDMCHVLQPAEREELRSCCVLFFVAQGCRHLGSILLAKVQRMEPALISSCQSRHQSPAPAPEDQPWLPAGSGSRAGTV